MVALPCARRDCAAFAASGSSLCAPCHRRRLTGLALVLAYLATALVITTLVLVARGP